MKEDIQRFLKKSGRGHDSDLAEGLANFLTQECGWLSIDGANAQALSKLSSVFTSRINRIAKHNPTDYDRGYSEGLREGLRIVKDQL